ncbi:MAG: peptidase M16 [Candidatus Rokubacteria bacterium 13_1_40CM_4_69_5]|nr:MAG: peptidase M16 [Candidatus Rokubacteria bacterium 13_1_40CM_4_69_5]
MIRAVIACALLLAALTPMAVSVAAEASRGTADVLATTLANGLRVLLLEDHRSPIISVQVWYRVGSRNEARGATGIAHFLEHMMFKGTPKHGPRQFARLVEQNGGQDNAFTAQDLTSYFVNIAAEKIDLVLDLEADRMRNLLLDPKEIESEREVVIEERRTRTEDDPEGFLGEEVSSIAFKAHPYGFPIIGWMEDLKRVTPAEIRAFYRTYYVPNNAILVAAGDFKAPLVLEKVKRWFGGIPRGSEPPPVLALEPPQNGERRVVVSKQAQLPIVYLAWHVPNQKSDDAPALEVLSTVLSGGRASRLYRHLVYERQLALEAGGDYPYFSLDPSLFWFWATAMPGQTPDTLEKELLAEMERLKSEPVTDEELERAKNQIEAQFVFQQDSVYRRASLLARFETIGGYRLLDAYVPRIRAITAADLQRIARAYFPADRRNVGILLPRP